MSMKNTNVQVLQHNEAPCGSHWKDGSQQNISHEWNSTQDNLYSRYCWSIIITIQAEHSVRLVDMIPLSPIVKSKMFHHFAVSKNVSSGNFKFSTFINMASLPGENTIDEKASPKTCRKLKTEMPTNLRKWMRLRHNFKIDPVLCSRWTTMFLKTSHVQLG